jgi:ligand-binding SRPBCC domain-containing protein
MPTFKTKTQFSQDIDEIFPFFSDAGNLEKITPKFLKFEILEKEEMKEGAKLVYSIKVHHLPMKWRTNIAKWDPPHCFIDEQISGPYKKWVHTHSFEKNAQGTLMTDSVDYEVSGWILSPLVHLFVRKDIEKIFSHREKILKEIFEKKN